MDKTPFEHGKELGQIFKEFNALKHIETNNHSKKVEGTFTTVFTVDTEFGLPDIIMYNGTKYVRKSD